jgi:L-asparaginase
MDIMIHLLTTGGTIASVPGDEGRNIAGRLDAADLLETARHAVESSVDTVRSESLFQMPSNAIGPDQLYRMADRCEALLDDPQTRGIVITHGTDTLEDTAFFLQLALGDCPRPIVVTGSQRALHESGTDAVRNLIDAMRVAARPDARGQGVLVVFNEAVHSAALAQKVSSYRLEGFGSPGFGPVGQIDGHRVRFALRARPSKRLPRGASMPRVDIASVAAGSHCPVSALCADGADGIVIDALGRGQVPPHWLDDVEAAIASGIPVAVASSTGSGPVAPVYEYRGSLQSLIDCGALQAGALSARQARILMMLLGSTPDATSNSFARRWAEATRWETD